MGEEGTPEEGTDVHLSGPSIFDPDGPTTGGDGDCEGVRDVAHRINGLEESGNSDETQLLSARN